VKSLFFVFTDVSLAPSLTFTPISAGANQSTRAGMLFSASPLYLSVALSLTCATVPLSLGVALQIEANADLDVSAAERKE